MGLGRDTAVVCARCQKTFLCGCVIVNVCPDCVREECRHEPVLTELGRFCKKCFQKVPSQ